MPATPTPTTGTRPGNTYIRAIGKVTAIDGDRITVTFVQPHDLNDTTQVFIADMGTRNFTVGKWVLAGWMANAPKDSTGAIRLQGNRGSARLQPAEHLIAGTADRLLSEETRKQISDSAEAGELDYKSANELLQMFTVEETGKYGTPGLWRGAWLATPVPLPGMDTEFLETDPSYLRLGAVKTHLNVPARDLQISRISGAEQVQTLRSGTPIQKGTWHHQKQVLITLTFAGVHSINQVLLPLLRQFRRMPFVPVYNHLLFQHDIDALTLAGLQVATIPGHPHALEVQLTCFEFNWKSYMPTALSLDTQICWPLLQLWLEKRENKDVEKDNRISRPIAMRVQWDGKFQLRPISREWLKAAIERPQLESRAGRQAADLEAAREVLAKTRPYQSDESYLNMATEDGRKLTLAENWGVVYLDATDTVVPSATPSNNYVILYRPRTLETALICANSPDLQRVVHAPTYSRELATPVPLNTTPAEFAYTPTYVRNLTPEKFRGLLKDSQDTTTPRLLETGFYVCEFHFHTTIFEQILNQEVIELVALSEEPELDEENAFRPHGLVIEQITASLENVIAPLQLRGQETAAHQFLGSTAFQYVLSGTLDNHTAVYGVEEFLQNVNRMALEFPGRAEGAPFGGFCRVDNELFALTGTRYVIPLHWRTSPVPGFPNALRWELTLVQFDPTQRQLEQLEHLIPGYDPTDPNGLMQAVESEKDSLKVRWLRQSEFHKKLLVTELYPDLALPRHEELADWCRDLVEDKIWDWTKNEPYPKYWFLGAQHGGTGWSWSTQLRKDASGELLALPLPAHFLEQIHQNPPPRSQRFSDPDFWCAASSDWGQERVDRTLREAQEQHWVLSDQHGAESEPLTVGDHITVSVVTVDPQGTVAKSDASAKGSDQGYGAPQLQPVGSTPSTFDRIMAGVAAEGSEGAAPQGAASADAMDRFRGFLDGARDGSSGNPAAAGEAPKPRALLTMPNETGHSLEARRNYYQAAALQAARAHGVPADLFFALIHQESSWKMSAVSPKVALGLGQLMLGTAAGLGIDPKDPAANLNGAARYLANQRKRFLDKGVDTQRADDLTVATYNSGPNLPEYDETPPRIPDLKETKNHVRKINEIRRTEYRNLAATTAAASSTEAGITNAETRRLVETLQQQFAEGRGWAAEVIGPWMHRDSTQLAGDPNPIPVSNRVTNAFVKEFWLERIIASTYTGSARTFTPGTVFSRYLYVVRDRYLEEFAKTAQRVNMPPLPTLIASERIDVGPISPVHRATVPTVYTGDGSAGRRDQDPLRPVTINQAFFDPVTGEDMFHDLRRSLLQGRLLGAFPTFYVALVDGGRRMRIWRLFDHLYGTHAITRIAIHRTRMAPAETAVVGMANMYGHLTAQAAEVDRIQRHDTRGSWNFTALERGLESLIRFDEETVTMWSQHVASMLLKPGARLHVRLGYGSDPGELPICFNGTITEVGADEGEVQVVAVSDGIELLNDIEPTDLQGSVPVVRKTGHGGAGMNPRNLVMEYMLPWSFETQIRQGFAEFTAQNPQGAGSAAGFVGGGIGGTAYGAARGAVMGSRLGAPGAIGGAAVGAYMGGVTGGLGGSIVGQGAGALAEGTGVAGKLGSLLYYGLRNPYGIEHFGSPYRNYFVAQGGEIGVNLYDPEHSLPVNRSTAWDNTLRILKPWRWGPGTEHLMGVNMAGATPWDLFNATRKTIPDYVLYPLPVELRSTLFMGKPWFPVYTDYRDLLPEQLLTADERTQNNPNFYLKRKIFQQFHLVNSQYNLIDNHVQADATDVYTKVQAVGTYNGWSPGADLKLESSFVMMLDSDIYDEFQKLKVVESGLYTTVHMKLQDGLKGEETLLNAMLVAAAPIAPQIAAAGVANQLAMMAVPFFSSRRIMDYYAAMELKDSVKLMYRGPFVLLGDAWIKPYDTLGVMDELSGMHGMAEAREVIHTFSVGTGFITEVTPDCIASYVDYEGQQLMMWLAMQASQWTSALTSAAILGALARQMSNRSVWRTVTDLRTGLIKLRDDPEALRKSGLTAPQINERLEELPEPRRLRERIRGVFTRTPATAARPDLKAILDKVFTANEWKEVYLKLPGALRGQLRATHELLNIGGTVSATASKLQPKIEGPVRDFLKEGIDSATKAVDDLEAAKTFRGWSDADLDEAAKRVDTVNKSTATPKPTPDPDDVTKAKLRNELRDAKSNLSTVMKRASQVKRTGRSLINAGTLIGKAFRRVAGVAVLAGVIEAGSGGLADWVTRWAISRQCLVLFPLKLRDREFSAGINGHRGAVYGDRLGRVDEIFQKSLDWYKSAPEYLQWGAQLTPVVGTIVQRVADSELNYDTRQSGGPYQDR